MRRVRGALVILGGLWLAGLLLALLNLWPWPTNARGWLWFLLLAPPTALLLEVAAEIYRKSWESTGLSKVVATRTDQKKFSWLRVCLALLQVGLVGVVVGGIAWIVQRVV